VLEETGIAKGIRRITGATRGAAKAATSFGESILAESKACGTLSGDQLEKELGRIRNLCDTATIPATIKEEIRGDLAAHTRRLLDAAKEALKAATQQAIADVQAKAAATKATGGKYFVAVLADDTDAPALRDAATYAFNEGIACTLLSNVKGKEFIFVSVPPEVNIDAKGWLDAVGAPLGAKGGGGKNGVAQGHGPNVDAVAIAIAAAEEFAKLSI